MTVDPDPLSELLEAFPLPTGPAGRFELTAPWGLGLPDRWAAVLAVKRGQFYVTSNGVNQTVSVVDGDVVVLSPSCAHELRDTPATPVAPIGQVFGSPREKRQPVLTFGGGQTPSTLLGGLFPFHGATAHPFYSALPPLVHLGQRKGGHAQQLEGIVQLIDCESASDHPGRRAVVGSLAEILLIQVMRVHLSNASNGSIRGMLHPDLSTALVLIHRQPERAWTVAELAKRSTMSRSAFSATFVSVLGKPPLKYLREHRMQLACRLLRAPSLGLKEIASRVGYDSVSAFSAAFKRFSGLSPGEYRRHETRADPAQAARATGGTTTTDPCL